MVRPGKRNKDFHDGTALANHLSVILAASDSEGINGRIATLPFLVQLGGIGLIGPGPRLGNHKEWSWRSQNGHNSAPTKSSSRPASAMRGAGAGEARNSLSATARIPARVSSP